MENMEEAEVNTDVRFTQRSLGLQRGQINQPEGIN